MKHFEVRLVKGTAGKPGWMRDTLRGMGISRIGSVVYLRDTPAVRGMIYKVVHMVEVAVREGDLGVKRAS